MLEECQQRELCADFLLVSLVVVGRKVNIEPGRHGGAVHLGVVEGVGLEGEINGN